MFDEKTLSTLATKAVLDSMTTEMRAELLARAVAGIFEMEDPRDILYGKKPRTKFLAAFDVALEGALSQVMRTLLQEPEYQTVLRDQVKGAMDKYMSSGGEEGQSTFSELVLKALSIGTEKLFERR